MDTSSNPSTPSPGKHVPYMTYQATELTLTIVAMARLAWMKINNAAH